jgi:hypothetical protein
MTTEINTLADIKTWHERLLSRFNLPPGGMLESDLYLIGDKEMVAEITDLRAYAEKQEAEKLAILDRLEKAEAKQFDFTCPCGLPMSRNPHADAGNPESLLEVGAVFVCIPCTVKSRHSAHERAAKLEQQIAASQQGSEPVALLKAAHDVLDTELGELACTGSMAPCEDALGRLQDALAAHPIAPAGAGEAGKAVLSRGDAGAVFVVPVGVMHALTEARDTAMRFTVEARIPECGHFGGIAQNLDWALDAIAAAQVKEGSHD